MTLATLVTGGSADARAAAIAAALDPHAFTAVIIEGLPSGNAALTAADSSHVDIAHIAPGCPCCSGNLTMRVTLNRLLRLRPARLFISLASAAHLEEVRAWLCAAPYDALLSWTGDLSVDG